jgi:putative aminopeptidase FrvX
MKLLKKLISIQGASGDERNIKEFIKEYVVKNSYGWKVSPEIIDGDNFQDTLILVFGQPRTAIFAHTDTIGFTVGYNNELIKIGGPKIEDGYTLVGSDSKGEIETELMIVENEDGGSLIKCISDRIFDRGTILTFKPNFRDEGEFIISPYLDNRLGVWSALEVAKTLENGVIVFSTYEEHGGGSVGFISRYLYDRFNLKQALISDITWVTNGVKHGKGVAISLRDSGIPRRVYLNKIIEIAKKSDIPFQLEVESAGGSDGNALQKSDQPFDWCFIGAAENHVHSPNETVHKNDIESMVQLYELLMQQL